MPLMEMETQKGKDKENIKKIEEETKAEKTKEEKKAKGKVDIQHTQETTIDTTTPQETQIIAAFQREKQITAHTAT